MTYKVGHYINGNIVTDGKGICQDIFNPATGTVAGQVIFATTQEAIQTVACARDAFPAWAGTTPTRRIAILFKFRELLLHHIDDIAAMVTSEHGKTLADAHASIMRGLDVVEFACGCAQQLQGTFSENAGSNIDCYTLRQPLGVCVAVSPFNFPEMIPLWLVAPAIACGNTVILKPSEIDPSVPVRLAELFVQAGLPDGVFNVLQGDKTVVNELLHQPEVCAVTAVGSTLAAESIYKTATAQGKRAHTFGGAKNHCVVLPDADLKATADHITTAAYGAAGERCMAISVVVAVGDEAADQLINAIKAKIATLKVGAGTQVNVDIGPLITQAHLARVKSYIEKGVAEGAKLIVDGRDINVPAGNRGFYLGASLFDQVTPQMKIYREEIFGPVLVLVRVADFTEAVTLINRNEYGNGVAIFTSNGQAARTFASQVEVGMVGINVAIPVPVACHSFGGWKRSFFGDIAMHGDQDVQFYTKLKTVTARWFDGESGRVQQPHYNMPVN